MSRARLVSNTWGAPREQTSSEKAQSYLHHYIDVIQADSKNCLGSFVFLWGQKQEITHTWYGMFSPDGLASEAVEVMRYLWSGQWPQNRAPKIQPPRIEGFAAGESIRLKAGALHKAQVSAEDPDDDSLRYHWEIKAEVEPASYAGIGEKPAEPVPGLIESASHASVEFSAPRKPGAYRLFVYAYDGKDHWAYANLPFLVIEEQ